MNIAEIGTNRLKNVLVTDKQQDPKKLTCILKNDMQNIAEDYLELEKDINVKIEEIEGKLKFVVEIDAKRIRSYGLLINE